MGERRRVHRIPLKEAADALGISKDAVRQRVRRGTLRSDKAEDGRVYVYLDTSTDDVHTETSRGSADSALVDEMRERIRYLERQVEEERDARRRADTLLARLMDRLPELEEPASEYKRPTRYLEHEEALREDAGLEIRTDEQRQRWHSHSQGAPRGAPQDAPEPPQDADQQQGRGSTQPTPPGAQEGARRPWWRRVFGS